MSDMTPQAVLALPMQQNDAEAAMIGDYLRSLLRAVWEEEEGFSGKRPFGNSGWKHEVYQALCVGGALPGTADEYGDLRGFDYDAADELIVRVINALVVAS